MAARVRRLCPALREGEELVAHVDERHPADAATQCQGPEDLLEQCQGIVERAHLERDVVDPDETSHGASVSA